MLQNKAKQIRVETMKMLIQAGSGHPAGSLGMADIFAALYFSILKHNPQNPKWEERDRLILSSGHIVPVWYATLALAGYFSPSELSTYRQINSKLEGHPLRGSVPGLENTSGPLGQGVSLACGIALAAKLKKQNFRVFCITSDGEQQEGQTWEAYLFASKYKLNNLTFILDRNYIQISGKTESVMPLEPLVSKLESFGLETIKINGHRIKQIQNAVQRRTAKPKIIIAQTIASKDVRFMENDFQWHGKVPEGEEAVLALKQLINNI